MLIAAGQSVKQGRFSAVLIPDQGNNHRVITYLRVDFCLQNKQLLIKEQKAATLQKMTAWQKDVHYFAVIYPLEAKNSAINTAPPAAPRSVL